MLSTALSLRARHFSEAKFSPNDPSPHFLNMQILRLRNTEALPDHNSSLQGSVLRLPFRLSPVLRSCPVRSNRQPQASRRAMGNQPSTENSGKPAEIIDGVAIAASIRNELKVQVDALKEKHGQVHKSIH